MSSVQNHKKKLKVLNIAESYPPGYAGGAAVYVHDTCKFLAERGHDIKVLCSEANDTPAYSVREETIEGVKIYRLNLPYLRREDPAGWTLGIAGWKKHCADTTEALEKILAQWQPDLVQYHTPFSVIEECLPSFLARNIPIVGMTHDFWTICMQASLFKSPTDTSCDGPSALKCLECVYSYWDGTRAKALAKLPWRLTKLGAFPAYRTWSRYNLRCHTDGLICYSKFLANAHQGRINGQVRHISLGIDLTQLPPAPLFADRPRTPLRFGFAAGFVNHKGIWELLDTVASLKNKGYNFELHIWGPKQSQEPLIERGIEDYVKLRGMYKPEEIWNVYAEMDVLLMNSRWEEPYGRVVQEAAAAKVPTIAPRSGGITEQIRNEVDGLLFNLRDREDMERQMIKVLEQPDSVKKMSDNLWQVINTKDAVVEMEKFYELILNERRAASQTSRQAALPA